MANKSSRDIISKSMVLIFLFYQFINTSAYLFNPNRKVRGSKLQILKTYFFLTVLVILHKFIHKDTVSIDRFRIQGFDAPMLHFLFGEIFVRGTYFFRSMAEHPVIIDAGANIGRATLYFKYIYPEATIYAFEPDKKSFQVLEKNIKENRLENVHAFNIALSDKKGKITFYTSENSGDLEMSIIKGRNNRNSNEVTVQADSLVSYIKHKEIDLIKMDIEGAEKIVLQDLYKKNGFGNVKQFIIEFHQVIGEDAFSLDMLLKLLREKGFYYYIDANGLNFDFGKKGCQAAMIYAIRD
jgi:FkbM family methyltransferase